MPPISLGIGLSLSMQGRGGKAWRDYDLFETGSGFLYDFNRADTLFQEATGITPAGVDQNVGLALDVSKWGGNTLAEVLAGQPELVTNGGFDSGTTGWSSVASAALSVVSGHIRVTNNGVGYGRASQAITCVIGRRYQVVVDFYTSPTAGGIRIGTVAGGGETLISPQFTSTRHFSASFVATATTHYVTLITDTAATAVGVYTEYDDVSVKEIPGNHASQATSAARPVRKAGLTRYDGSDDNLLTTLVPSATMTLAMKLKVPVAGLGTKILMGATHPGAHCYLGMANSGSLGAGIGTGTLGLITDNVNRAGQTGVLAVTADASTVNLYWNGANVYSGAASDSPAGATPIRLGARNNGGTADLFSAIDDYQALAINRALTPAEITKLTNAWSA